VCELQLLSTRTGAFDQILNVNRYEQSFFLTWTWSLRNDEVLAELHTISTLGVTGMVSHAHPRYI